MLFCHILFLTIAYNTCKPFVVPVFTMQQYSICYWEEKLVPPEDLSHLNDLVIFLNRQVLVLTD